MQPEHVTGKKFQQKVDCQQTGAAKVPHGPLVVKTRNLLSCLLSPMVGTQLSMHHVSLLAVSIHGGGHRSPFVRDACVALLIGLLKNG